MSHDTLSASVTGARSAEAGSSAPAVSPTAGRVRPLGTAAVSLGAGLLQEWQERNRERTIPHTIAQLGAAGNLENLRTVATGGDAPYRGRYPFLDTDVFKTLEGLAYELGREDASTDTREFFEEAVALLQSAQADDGYLNSFFQHPGSPKQPWSDLTWGHELYNLGHLIQAAVAASRQLGDDRLLGVATRFADLAVQRFGPRGDLEVCGHPEVEMALVELHRLTGTADYLTLAKLFVERRGHGTVKLSVFPAEYFQDSAPLSELPSVTGHAVRMGYLAAGAADVAIETGDHALLAALERLWDDMAATKLYITGGLGSRHSDEAIGDRYELPSERSYSETCAAIAVMQWAWRMFLATEKAHYLDTFETVLYNAYAAGLSADGCAFFYDNPLQRRPDHQQRTGAEPDGELLRRAWFVCPCCPPNVIRWTSELQDHVAATAGNTLYVAQYTEATVRSERLSLSMSTAYPWDGTVTIDITAASAGPTELALRVPAWCHRAEVTVNGSGVDAVPRDGWLRPDRVWSAGDSVVLELAMPVRAHGSHPHVDATRGALALARGPLVYCAEQQDNAGDLDDLSVTAADVAGATLAEARLTPESPAESVVLTVPARIAPPPAPALYPELGSASVDSTASASASATERSSVTLVPYYLWGNREPGAMRVWLRQH
ncbi:glycoside hydrolase family 127 protein [Microbacteriaceae bacterium 4G12]